MSFETEIFRKTQHPALRRKRFTRRDSWITDPEIEPSDPPTSPFGDNFLSIPHITEDMDDLPTVLDKLRDITAILSRLNWPVPTADGDNNFVLYDGVGDGSGLTGIDGGWSYSVVTGPATPSGANQTFYLCDASGPSDHITITLPASPSTGNRIGAKDTTGGLASIVIDPNGKNIDGASGNRTLNTTNYTGEVYVYNGTDWSIVYSYKP